MAIATYAELVSKIGEYIGNSDDTGKIADWITLAHGEIAAYLAMEGIEGVTKAAVTVDEEYEDLPAGFLGFERIVIGSPPRQLKQVAMGSYAFETTGQPLYVAVVGSEVQFLPAPSQAEDGYWVYRANLTALSDSATTNWVLTAHPAIYLHGALKHAGIYYRDEGMIGTHAPLFDAALEALRLKEWNRQFGRMQTETWPSQGVV